MSGFRKLRETRAINVRNRRSQPIGEPRSDVASIFDTTTMEGNVSPFMEDSTRVFASRARVQRFSKRWFAARSGVSTISYLTCLNQRGVTDIGKKLKWNRRGRARPSINHLLAFNGQSGTPRCVFHLIRRFAGRTDNYTCRGEKTTRSPVIA